MLILELLRNFLIRNSTNIKMIRDLITVSGTLRIEQNIGNHYSHLRKIRKDFDWRYWWFNKAFLHRKAKNYQFLIQGKIQSYHWSKEYCKLHPLVVYYLGPWFSVLFLMATTITQYFFIKFKQCLLIILKLITHL